MKPDRRVATSARRITDQNPWVSLIGDASMLPSLT
jgi:hypothetical protein